MGNSDLEAQIDEFPCIFPASKEIGFQRRVRSRLPPPAESRANRRLAEGRSRAALGSSSLPGVIGIPVTIAGVSSPRRRCQARHPDAAPMAAPVPPPAAAPIAGPSPLHLVAVWTRDCRPARNRDRRRTRIGLTRPKSSRGASQNKRSGQHRSGMRSPGRCHRPAARRENNRIRHHYRDRRRPRSAAWRRLPAGCRSQARDWHPRELPPAPPRNSPSAAPCREKRVSGPQHDEAAGAQRSPRLPSPRCRHRAGSPGRATERTLGGVRRSNRQRRGA